MNSPQPRRKPSKHLFNREDDGTVRLRMRFTAEDAVLFEHAAGATPVMDWILETLRTKAREDLAELKAQVNSRVNERAGSPIPDPR